MYKQHTVAVVVPAYNEEGFVGNVLRTIPSFVDRVYVVDDCSTDGTWREIQGASAELNAQRTVPSELTANGREGYVVAVRHEENMGRGSSVKDGYRLALEDGIDVTAVMDGDGQMDPDELGRILSPVVEGRADYAKGTRLRERDHTQGMTRWRLFGNHLLSFLTNLSSGYWGMGDSQNGYAAISREALEEIPIDDLYDGYGFLNDILTVLNVHGLTIAEVPHPAVYDEEESGIRYSTFVPLVSILLLTNFLYRIGMRYAVRDFHPTILCYGLGVGGLLAGGLGGLIGLVAGGVALVAMSHLVTALLVGLILFVFGIVLDIQQNSELAYRYDRYPDPDRQRQ